MAHGSNRYKTTWSRVFLLCRSRFINFRTPAGVGMGYTPPRFLKRGNIVTCEIGGIGRLTNRIFQS
ncbi:MULTISPECIES: fumarylacetoacetate hydrolase family protein [Clostridium]